MRHGATNSNYGLIGTSPAMQVVRDLIIKAGASRAPVLITGETGTGKELVARAIHSCDEKRPFVLIDCGSVVDSLFSSELFGHEAGAFTGALAPKKGLLEAAHGGTAFLDEIGELPLTLQSHLLHALGQSEARRLGALHPVRFDVRVLAATNRDLKRAVAEGKFRQDLYYRLKVITINVPPLRSRREDIPELVRHFSAKHRLTAAVGEDVIQMLQYDYPWLGNVRELENCICRLAALCSGPTITMRDLPDTIRLARAAPHIPSGWGETNASEAERDLGQPGIAASLKDGEALLIRAALQKSAGQIQQAAGVLGVGRTTLYRKLKQYCIEAGEFRRERPSRSRLDMFGSKLQQPDEILRRFLQ